MEELQDCMVYKVHCQVQGVRAEGAWSGVTFLIASGDPFDMHALLNASRYIEKCFKYYTVGAEYRPVVYRLQDVD